MFWLDEITLKAQKALEEYTQEFNGGNPLTLPIPIEEIIDFKYGIRIIPIGDPKFQKEYSGYYDRNNRIIGINKKEHYGRRHFTLGHELGHHVLGHLNEQGLFRDRKNDIQENTPEQPRKTIEREADKFAAEIMMPSERVKEVFHHKLTTPISEGLDWSEYTNHTWKTGRKIGKLELIAREMVPTISQLAREFGVSEVAMRYKLTNLRLIQDGYQYIIGLADIEL